MPAIRLLQLIPSCISLCLLIRFVISAGVGYRVAKSVTPKLWAALLIPLRKRLFHLSENLLAEALKTTDEKYQSFRRQSIFWLLEPEVTHMKVRLLTITLLIAAVLIQPVTGNGQKGIAGMFL